MGLSCLLTKVTPPSSETARHWRCSEIQLAVLLDRRAGAAAAEHLVILIRYKGDRERRPVDKVRRREVAPVHGAPLGLVRIVLEEQVRLSVIEDRAVRVVGPPGRDGRVVFGSVTFTHYLYPPVRKICVKDGTVSDSSSYKILYCISSAGEMQICPSAGDSGGRRPSQRQRSFAGAVAFRACSVTCLGFV